MNITSDYPVMVFKNDKGIYSIGLSDRKQDGSYVNWYKSVSFKKGTNIDNKTNIYIKKAWLKCNEVNGKKYEYLFISDYETVAETIEKSKQELGESDVLDPIGNIDDELPF